MLSRVSLKNFKLHSSTVIDAAPITVFIGPNNSGKSSILQALLCLRQAASQSRTNLCQPVQRQPTSLDQPYLLPEDQIIVAGEFKDILRQGENEVQIGVVGRARIKPFKYGSIDIDFDVHVRDDRLVYHRGKLNCSGETIGWGWQVGLPDVRHSIQIDGTQIHLRPEGNFQLIAGVGMTLPENFPPERSSDLQELSSSLSVATILFLKSLHPIFPLRGFEEWGYPLPDNPAGNLERMVLSDRSIALASILAYDRELEDRLSDWLEELLQIRIKFKLLPRKTVTIRTAKTRGKNGDTLFSNEGTGANQIPFILVPIGLTPPNETIFLCEPEAHLHPKAQSDLASLLLRVALKENRQFFIETHSEHILHSLLHSVARGELDKNQIFIYYFENQNGTAEVKRLEIDESGRVEGGLPGFFDHSLRELSEYLDVLKKN